MKKTCSKCGVTKSIEEFYKNKKSRDGFSCQCKECNKKYSKLPSRSISKKRYAISKKGKEIRKKSYKKYYQSVRGYLVYCFHRMKSRCNNTKYRGYPHYGGRGIKCLFESSTTFIDYVINILKVNPLGLQVDRIDNEGNYEEGNIRFVTREVNRNNRRDSK